MKEFAKKALNFFGLCASVLGTIGGFGYAAYNKAWLLAYMAFPKFREYIEKLMS